MSTTPDAFGSISSDAYRAPGTQALPPFSAETLSDDATAGLENPRVNTNTPTVAYNVDQDAVPAAQPDHTAAPAHAPNSWQFGRDPYKNDGVSDSGV